MGLDGAAYANLLSQSTSALLLVLYVFWRDLSMVDDERSTWLGLSIGKALEPKAVWQYMSYGVPATAMICLEWCVHTRAESELTSE